MVGRRQAMPRRLVLPQEFGAVLPASGASGNVGLQRNGSTLGSSAGYKGGSSTFGQTTSRQNGLRGGALDAMFAQLQERELVHVEEEDAKAEAEETMSRASIEAAWAAEFRKENALANGAPQKEPRRLEPAVTPLRRTTRAPLVPKQDVEYAAVRAEERRVAREERRAAREAREAELRLGKTQEHRPDGPPETEEASPTFSHQLSTTASVVSLRSTKNVGDDEECWRSKSRVLGAVPGGVNRLFLPFRRPFSFFADCEAEQGSPDNRPYTATISAWAASAEKPNVSSPSTTKLSTLFPVAGPSWLGFSTLRASGKCCRDRRVWQGFGAPSPWPLSARTTPRLPDLVFPDSEYHTAAVAGAHGDSSRRLLGEDRTQIHGDKLLMDHAFADTGGFGVGGRTCTTPRRKLVGDGRRWQDEAVVQM